MYHRLLKEFRNIPGWLTNRKIVVFESDDWGSSRINDKTTYDQLVKMGYDPSRCYMSKLDSIERNDDIEGLLNILSLHKDINGNHPKFTFFFNPANPDFKKIKEADFDAYFFEPFTETIKNYKNTDRVIDLFKTGIENNFFSIQFHGREHLYVNRWLRDLRQGNKDLLNGFSLGFWGFSRSYAPNLSRGYRASFDLDILEDLISQKEQITSGVDLIKQTFNVQPFVFVAPDGPYNLSLNSTLKKSGIRYIGLAKKHKEPLGNGQTSNRYFWLGQKLKNQSLTVITRNAIFEPGKPTEKEWVNACLRDVQSAFRWKKPAVVSSHRANYIGTHSLGNRNKGLKDLSFLISKIKQIWPDVEFMTSVELGDLISKK